jgi:hypothetical protein
VGVAVWTVRETGKAFISLGYGGFDDVDWGIWQHVRLADLRTGATVWTNTADGGDWRSDASAKASLENLLEGMLP